MGTRDTTATASSPTTSASQRLPASASDSSHAPTAYAPYTAADHRTKAYASAPSSETGMPMIVIANTTSRAGTRTNDSSPTPPERRGLSSARSATLPENDGNTASRTTPSRRFARNPYAANSHPGTAGTGSNWTSSSSTTTPSTCAPGVRESSPLYWRSPSTTAFGPSGIDPAPSIASPATVPLTTTVPLAD